MKFGNTLAETLVPEWRQYYINYEGLKQRLKQARDTCDDFLESVQRPSTSLSIPRSLSQPRTALLQHALQAQHSLQQEQQQLQEQGSPSYRSSSWQQHAGSGPELCQGLQSNNPEQQLKHSGSQPSLCIPAALQLDGGPAEQFLQLLQQELNKVREFVVSHGAALQAELTALAAAAPQLSQQDCQQLEQQANELGRQLLALEAYVQLNQAGFVKIVKKHDKWLPAAPIWHLYLHHLQRSPWLDDSSRQVMWAALSSCYYHLHAGSLNSSRANSRLQQQHQQQQRQQQQQPSPRGLSSTASSSSSIRPGTGQQPSSTPAASAAVGVSVTASPAKAQAAAASSSSKRVVGGLTSALGSAVAGAASVMAGAATAVAGASAAALAAAGGAAPSSRQATPRTPEAEEVPTVKFTRKFWVAESDVPAVMYYILQHLPLLPSTANPAAAVNNNNAQGGDCLTARLSGSHQQLPRRQHQQQHASSSGNQLSHSQHQSQQQQGQQQQRLLLQPALQGFATTLHTVYLDNSSLQLYHGRLYLRPQTQTLKARWIGHSHDSTSSNNPFLADCSTPDKVVLERKIYREGWKGEPNTKDSLLIAGDKLPQYLAGAYTLGDALADLCEVPACKAQLIRASSTVKEQQQQQLWQSPFAQASGAAAGVAAVSAGGVDYDAAAAADGEAEDEAAMLAASVKVPKGFAIGSISSRSLGQASDNGSHPSLLQLLERDRQQQQQQQREEEQEPHQGQWCGQTSECSAGTSDTGSDNQEGFADAYLDPPVPSADQLSLFMEVQRFVGRRRLRPVLHCVLQRMVFAMPFDNRIRITLDTDVRTKALGQDLPLSAADWQQQRQLSSSRGGSGVVSPEFSSDPPAASAADAAACRAAAGLSSSLIHARQQHPLPPRPSSGGGSSSNPVASDLQRSLAAWGAIFDSRGPQMPFLSGQYSGREPGSPVHWHSSSGDADAIVHTLPYALLKVTVQLPANQSAPDWLLQLMDSEAVTPVEDWSKFIHGCAVLLPETVRAVPYWMDDRLIELSVAALQAQLEAEEARRDQVRLQSLRAHSRRSSTGGLSAADNSSGGGAAGPAAATAGSAAGTSCAGHHHQQQQQQPLLQRLSGSFRSALARTSSGGMGTTGRHPSHSSSFNGLQQQEQHRQLAQQAPSHVSAAAASTRAGISSSGGSSLGHSRLRVATAGSAPRVSWADGGGGSSSSPAGGTPSHTDSASALAAAAGSGAGLLLRIWRLVRKQKPPPLFRPEGFSGLRRPRRGNPVQLLESREFFYSEAVFLQWLHLAITIASVAILLMGYSSMAYVNPLKRPTLHVAEIICLLMLPCSCIIVGYAIRTYLWRRRRLHSMRYSRVDDPVGPLLMALVFVASMSAIMLVNIADLVLLLKASDDSGGDDAGGGDEGGGDYELWAASGLPGSAVALRRARFLR